MPSELLLEGRLLLSRLRRYSGSVSNLAVEAFLGFFSFGILVQPLKDIPYKLGSVAFAVDLGKVVKLMGEVGG